MNIPRLTPIDTSIVQRMRNFDRRPKLSIVDKIRGIIITETGVDPLILRHYRGMERVQARQLFIVMLVNFTALPYREISALAGKNHATVNHCIIQVKNLVETDKFYKEMYDRIESKIKCN